MRFELYTDVALARDLPELGLRRGDLVKLVDHHVAPDGEEGYSIEVFNAVGETIAVSERGGQRTRSFTRRRSLECPAVGGRWITNTPILFPSARARRRVSGSEDHSGADRTLDRAGAARE